MAGGDAGVIIGTVDVHKSIHAASAGD